MSSFANIHAYCVVAVLYASSVKHCVARRCDAVEFTVVVQRPQQSFLLKHV